MSSDSNMCGDCKPSILILIPDHVFGRVISPEAEEKLHSFADVRRGFEWGSMSVDESIALLQDIDGILTSWGVHPFPSEAVTASERVKILSHAAGGVRWVPREAIENGLVVTNASEVMAPHIAEMCLTFTLMGLHNVLDYVDSSGRSSIHSFCRRRLAGKTVGLVGFGWIARKFVRMLEPFNVNALAFDPYVTDDEMARLGVRASTLEEVFSRSDVISVHAGSTLETQKMIGTSLLSMIKDSAIFINTARGSIVNHDALVAAARDGRFLVFLDVTDPEPLPLDHELRSMPNVVITPHCGGASDEPIFEVGDAAIEDLRRFFAGEPLLHQVTLEWYDRMT